MKKCIKLILLSILFFVIAIGPAYARAGGGSGGGSSGGGSGGSSGGGTHAHSSNRRSPEEQVIGTIIVLTLFYSSAILLHIKQTKLKISNKKKIKKLSKNDVSWNYKELQEQVVEAYFVIQEAWKNNDLESASKFLSPELFEQFHIKLTWMELQNKKNIMDKIELNAAFPISFYDDLDDEKDYVWYYIKGKMVDYIINTETEKIIEGNSFKKSFVEYWQFKKNKENHWVLNKILQADERKKIEEKENS